MPKTRIMVTNKNIIDHQLHTLRSINNGGTNHYSIQSLTPHKCALTQAAFIPQRISLNYLLKNSINRPLTLSQIRTLADQLKNLHFLGLIEFKMSHQLLIQETATKLLPTYNKSKNPYNLSLNLKN